MCKPMKELVFMSRRVALTNLLSKMDGVVHWGQLAQSYYRHHVRLTRYYLWSSALLIVIAIACDAWFLFDGPQILIAPATSIPLILIALRVDRKVSFHFQAAAEYRLSVAEFDGSRGARDLPRAIGNFEYRCGRYDPHPISATSTP